jgi:hypothetical protein
MIFSFLDLQEDEIFCEELDRRDEAILRWEEEFGSYPEYEYGEEEDKEDDGQFFEITYHTFNIKCKKRLSLHVKRVLLSWNGRSFYDANEDILYLFKSDRIEQDFLLKTLHSMAIFLQNSTCASFFNILISNVTITSAKADTNYGSSEFVESITFQLTCFVTPPPEEPETAW